MKIGEYICEYIYYVCVCVCVFFDSKIEPVPLIDRCWVGASICDPHRANPEENEVASLASTTYGWIGAVYNVLLFNLMSQDGSLRQTELFLRRNNIHCKYISQNKNFRA
jgi:hypothetical protein